VHVLHRVRSPGGVRLNRSVSFFDAQFRRQAESAQFELNPFERRTLPFLGGSVLELGCGLGNLSVAAAQQGARVLALDASQSAIDSLSSRAASLKLAVTAQRAELDDYVPQGEFDCVVAIGLLMFFPPQAARRQLARALAAVRRGGLAAINVLVEGTTCMEMFDAERGYCLFREDELALALEGWRMLDDRVEEFEGSRGTVKRFRTSIARRANATR